MTRKEQTLSDARGKALTYFGRRAELEGAREEMVEAVYVAAENGNTQDEIARYCSFPDAAGEFVFSRSRIQQFIRERRKERVRAA